MGYGSNSALSSTGLLSVPSTLVSLSSHYGQVYITSSCRFNPGRCS